MLTVQTLQLAMSGVAGAVLGSGSVFALLRKKGVDVSKVIDTVDQDLATIQPVINLANAIVPGNPIVNVVDIIDKAAITGAKYAEQLCHANQLTSNEDRKTAAKDTVYAALKEFNITPNANQEQLINATIEAAVSDLGHKDPTEAQKQAAQQALQAQVVQLTTEKAQLQNTINTITTAATAVNTPQPTQINTQQTA